jgi:hypothetical protein
MLADTYAAATADKQHGAAATAAMGIAKLHGLLVEKHEDVTRRATRDPAAPKEIDVDHWVTEQRAALSPAVDDMGLGAAPAAVDSVPEPQEKGRPAGQEEPLPDRPFVDYNDPLAGAPEPSTRSDAGLDIVMVHTGIVSEPANDQSPAEGDNPQGSEALSPEGLGWRKIN